MHYSKILVVVACVVFLANCTKPTLVGNDLLDNEKAELLFKDDFDLSFTTVKQDSILTYSADISEQLVNYLCGEIDDPIFGKYRSEIFTQMSLDFNTNPLSLFGSTIDSIVMTLAFDTNGLYGNVGQPVDIEVLRMQDLMNLDDDIYSSRTFNVDEDNPVGELNGIVLKPMDSVKFTMDTIVTELAPHLRIPLSIDLFSPVLTALDTPALLNQDTLNMDYFNGFNIRMTKANNSMYGFRLGSEISGITVYYTKDSTQSTQRFGFEFTIAKTATFEHDYSGSVIEPFIGDPEKGDSLFFIQGLSGVNTIMNIGSLDELGSALINHAQLEFYTATLSEDDLALYPKIEQLITMNLDDENGLEVSEDAFLALASSSLNTIFGGKVGEPIAGTDISRYKMIITGQVQEIFKGEKENAIYLSLFLKANLPNRSVIFGPDHAEYAPRLRVAYTRVN